MSYQTAWTLLVVGCLVAWCVCAYTDRNTERAFRRYNGKALGDVLHEMLTNDKGDEK